MPHRHARRRLDEQQRRRARAARAMRRRARPTPRSARRIPARRARSSSAARRIGGRRRCPRRTAGRVLRRAVGSAKSAIAVADRDTRRGTPGSRACRRSTCASSMSLGGEHEPALLVRARAAQRVDELDEHGCRSPSAAREAQLVDVHVDGRGDHPRASPSATSAAPSICARGVNPGRLSGSIGSQSCVSTGPGETSVARTPLPRSSARSTSCSARSAVLARGVRGVSREDAAVGDRADRDDVPAARARASPGGRRARGANGATRFTSSVRAKRSVDVSCAAASEKSAGVVDERRPALRRASVRDLLRPRARSAPRSPTSQARTGVRAELARERRRAPSRPRATSATRAPAAASARATSRADAARRAGDDAPIVRRADRARRRTLTVASRARGAGTRRASSRRRGRRRAAPR